MKLPTLRLRVRRPSPRAWVGITLIAVSIAGTSWVVSTSSTGTVIVLAVRPIAAGHTISPDDIATARVHGDAPIDSIARNDVLGKRAATTIAEGEQIVSHDIDFSAENRSTLAVPLGIEPARSITAGTRVQLWFVATDDPQPPVLIASDAVVEGIRAASFGSGSTIDASVLSRENNAVLSALGGKGMVVATTGSPTS